MKVNVIIDGNFILHKNVFLLKRVNEIYGKLEIAMNNSCKAYKNLFPFDKVYFASDAKGGSWRKKVYPEYKGNREKDDSIDWESVMDIYATFKKNLPKRYTLLESKFIEGDDWISHLIEKYINESFIIISNDRDLKQLVSYNSDRIVFMSNEMYKDGKLFMPKGYKKFLRDTADNTTVDLFDMPNDLEFIRFIKNYVEASNTEIVENKRYLIEKIIMGDKGDNIPSSILVNKRGIGEAGAKKLYDKYINEYNKEPNINDSDFLENLADLICEYKKLSYNRLEEVIENLKFNIKMMRLDSNTIPKKINERMDSIICPKGIM